MNSDEKINVIIPIGGVGKRFSDEGYIYPKPLINVLGKPMIARVLRNLDQKYVNKVIIVYNPYLSNFNFEEILKFQFRDVNFQFIRLKGKTKGAVHTISFGLEQLTNEDLDRGFLVMDCDTFYNENILEQFSNKENKNCIFYFKDEIPSPIFSYIKLNNCNEVIDIEEKVKISDNANTGAYGFKTGHVLKIYCDKLINNPSSQETYISLLYGLMLKDGIKITSSLVKNFVCLGTPIHVKTYCRDNADKVEKLRICFDLDNTLVTYPTISGKYETVLPIEKNINLLKYFKSLGHTIIIYTARHMKTTQGNVSLAISRIGPTTFDTLKKFDIPYDELYFGKPYADFYIDDLAINTSSNIENEIGIYNTDTESRHFNKIEKNNHTVLKTTNNDGELYFYRNIPIELKLLFPDCIKIEGNTIEMENIQGITYSYLYINNNFSTKHLTNLFRTIDIIHNCSVKGSPSNINSNYAPKLKARTLSNLQLMKELDTGLGLYYKIFNSLCEYEEQNLAIPSVIHGDMVFTNIIILPDERLKFIDMRGKVGDELTIFGDKFYDYAKVYQSIVGYDFILNGLQENVEYVYTFDNKFTSYITETFGGDYCRYIKYITASLIYSLIPIHNVDMIKFNRYIRLINKLISNTI